MTNSFTAGWGFEVKRERRCKLEHRDRELFAMLILEGMQDSGIIRNRQKLKAAVTNAKAFLQVQKEFGSFDTYIWGFTGGKVIDHHLADVKDMPAKDALSEKVSKDLMKRGFKFAGPVIIYSYLQGIGVINDHWEYCDYR